MEQQIAKFTYGDMDAHWPTATIKEALRDAEIFVDGDWVETKDQDPEGDVRLIQLADIGDGSFIDKSSRFLNTPKAKKLRCTFLKRGDVLVARMPDPLGRACIFPGLPQPSVTVVDVCIMRPNPARLDPRFLMHAVNSPLVRTSIGRQATGSTRQRISRGNLGKIEIHLPPLAEQRRIAAVLDKASELRAKRRVALELLDQLPQAIFIEMFGDPITNPNRWPNTSVLAEVAELVSGITVGRKLNGKSVREIPYLAVVNVQDKHLNLNTVKRIDATEDEIARYQLRAGDLLLTEGGDPDKLGRGTLWNAELPEAIHQNHVFRVRLTSPSLTPLYLSWLIGSTYGKAYFLRQAKQTTGIATINMGQLKAFPLLVPPLVLQDQFVARVEAIHRAKIVQHSNLTEIETLFSSLQSNLLQ